MVKKLTEFYVSDETHCKECVRKRVIANRNAKRNYYREFDRKRAMLPHRVSARREYIQTEAGRAAHNRAVDKWEANNRKKKFASQSVGNAVRDGKLKKYPCFVCGKKAQAHHPDYDQPLDVVWLCPKHHKQAHEITRKAA